MKNFILILIISGFVLSCNNSEKKQLSAFEKQMEANKHPGKKLMETNCYTCHSPSATQSDRIAPPMVAIKKHYIDSDTKKEDFIKAMQEWIKNPNAEDAKMFGAVKRFGIMPKQPYPEKTIEQIADYMFDFDIDQPEWFEDHFNEEKQSQKSKGMGVSKGMHKQQAAVDFTNLPDAERGLKYALTTKAVLGKNLMATIQKKGTLEALAFCNEKAYPLTDSMSVIHNATVKRVSDKPRNPNNQANTKELAYINSFKDDIKNNKEPEPIAEKFNGKVHVYYPITTNGMCLQCHGKPNETIQKPTLDKLSSLYPKDKAVGYSINQVRGIWSVSFNK